MQKWEYLVLSRQSSSTARDLHVHDIRSVVDLGPFISEYSPKVEETATGTRLHGFESGRRAELLMLDFLGQLGWEAVDVQDSEEYSHRRIYFKRPIEG